MNLYQKEKARIRIGYHYFIMAACMYFFFMQVQSETSMQISAMNAGMGVGDSVILAPDSPYRLATPHSGSESCWRCFI